MIEYKVKGLEIHGPELKLDPKKIDVSSFKKLNLHSFLNNTDILCNQKPSICGLILSLTIQQFRSSAAAKFQNSKLPNLIYRKTELKW